MSSLRELELQQTLREGAEGNRRETADVVQRFDWTQADMDRAWQKLTKPIIGLAESLANLPDSLDAAIEFQRFLPRDVLTELAPMTPEKLLEFGRQLRQLWNQCEMSSWNNQPLPADTQELLNSWWLEHDLYNRARWTVHFPTGRLFPTFLNFHALFARVCFDNWIHLGTCLNCRKYFYKPLRKSKFCRDCHAYDNRKRAQKFRANRKAKTEAARKGKGRKS